MLTVRHAWLSLVAVALFATLLSACGKLNLGGGPPPTASPSSIASPTPGACATINPNSNVVLVAMGSGIVPTSAPTYGPIGNYAVVDQNQGTFPSVGMVIDEYVNSNGKAVPITANNVLQFTNVDGSQTPVNHSAVGFKGDAFPHQSFTFPPPAAMPAGTSVSNTTLWSTGRVAPSIYSQCYSQSFTLKAGVYYFGDYDFFNAGGYRDALVVSTPRPNHMKLTKSVLQKSAAIVHLSQRLK